MGFVVSNRRAVAASLLVSAPMWAFLPLASLVAGGSPRVASDWPQLVLGVLLLNGLTEEVVHRAFVFGRLRERRSFFGAASIGAAVFALQHLYLVATVGIAAGLASVVLALLLAFPLAHLFELGGNSIVGPAIVHTSSNASFLVLGDPGGGSLLLLHMLVVLVSIYAAFLFPRHARDDGGKRAEPF